ncbi:hypothetical protein D3C71_599100 [compost metagenome]
MTVRPLWLQSAAALSLLNTLVDRLDAAEHRGSMRAGSVSLGEKTWPALYKAERESDKEFLWSHVCDMARWKWLSVKPEMALRKAAGYAMSPKVTVVDEGAVRTAIGRPERTRSSLERWRAAVDAHLEASPSVKTLVSDFCIDLPGYEMAAVVERLNGLHGLVDKGLYLREVSSRLFWGMSKVLDKRQPMVNAILGLEECPFPELPIQLHVWLPEGESTGILFIENALSYEWAIGSLAPSLSGLVLVFASGFKGTAQRLRTPAGSSLYFSDKGHRSSNAEGEFKRWLYQDPAARLGLPVFFWGDLDFAGMGILAALRTSFPEAQAWAPGYELMLAALESGRGHVPEAAEKKGQRIVEHIGSEFADTRLISALIRTGQFVDQELFRP